MIGFEKTLNVKVRTEARREAILAAAKDVFEEVGFEQATMSEITARVGGSKATLYRYFESKEALFMELVRRSALEHRGEVTELFQSCAGSPTMGLPPAASEALALLDPGTDVKASLQRFGERVVKNFHTPQKMAIKRMVIAAVGNNPELGRMFYENGPRKGMELIERYFESVMAVGKLRRVAPKVVAAHFRGLLESELLEPGLLNLPIQLSDRQIKAIVARAVDVFMRAYGPESV
ncbi:TetR/AcrR family transcriptional regulator [Ralstonia solanacearum]|uniref:TetR/AcrR family transcriptional regulator n=1 Tax=Ralstonia solanacearum TaxID=305 RepID=UPI001867844B|nr:TetR/AcrR family transcriptional regulator [Ralstonia solanacearum]QOK82109.1 TetR/AcrR family transcriptional regulator [Ralstonia solanacearum]